MKLYELYMEMYKSGQITQEVYLDRLYELKQQLKLEEKVIKSLLQI